MESFPLPNRYVVEETGDHSATIMIEPMYPGYGTTLGNALRRVLLSSLPGTAVVSMKIPRVDHEFSTIEGVKEDAVQVILNLKQLSVKLHTEEPQVLKLVASKEGPVTAGDFEENSEVEVANKDLVLAHVTKKDSGFEMEVTIDQGRGYIPVEQRKGEDLGVGVIAIDAIYSPIKKVGYAIENVRVGQRTDFDKLRLDIETDGTITPEEAFLQATQLQADLFDAIVGKGSQDVADVDSLESDVEESQDVLLSSIDLSTRTENILAKDDIATVDQLLNKSDKDLLGLDGFGESALTEINEALTKLGIVRDGK